MSTSRWVRTLYFLRNQFMKCIFGVDYPRSICQYTQIPHSESKWLDWQNVEFEYDIMDGPYGRGEKKMFISLKINGFHLKASVLEKYSSEDMTIRDPTNARLFVRDEETYPYTKDVRPVCIDFAKLRYIMPLGNSKEDFKRAKFLILKQRLTKNEWNELTSQYFVSKEMTILLRAASRFDSWDIDERLNNARSHY